MSAEQVATTRFILHLAGVLGAAVAGLGWANDARALLNSAHVMEQPGDTGAGVIQMFWRGARANAETIASLTGRNVERMALTVHLVLVGSDEVADTR